MTNESIVILIGGPEKDGQCWTGQPHTVTRNWRYFIDCAEKLTAYLRGSIGNRVRFTGKIHWIVADDPYGSRFYADKKVTGRTDTRWAALRNAHAITAQANIQRFNAVQGTGFSRDYRGVIEALCHEYKVEKTFITTADDFWDYLGTKIQPKHSLKEFYYFGHATKSGLVLAPRAGKCGGSGWAQVSVAELIRRAEETTRWTSATLPPSVPAAFADQSIAYFYGSHTKGFAASWSKHFGVPAYGDDGVSGIPSQSVAGFQRHFHSARRQLFTDPKFQKASEYSLNPPDWKGLDYFELNRMPRLKVARFLASGRLTAKDLLKSGPRQGPIGTFAEFKAQCAAIGKLRPATP